MQPIASPLAGVKHWFREDIEEPAIAFLGGPARFKVIVLLACVLGLDGADKATIGAIAVKLEQALHISNLQVGLLVTASTAIGVFAILPLGILADRVKRVRLLTAAVVVWSLAMAVSGFSISYAMLLFTRLALGAIVATAAPVVASLIGDFFQPAERGRIFGFILTGELLGVAFGFLMSGSVADFFTWRTPFWILAAIGLALAVALYVLLPEPARGGQSRIALGANEFDAAADTSIDASSGKADDEREEDQVEEEIEEAGIKPDPRRVPAVDPARLSWPRAVRYILSIRTNVLIIVASALGYFYLAGLETFGVVYMHGRFDLSQSAASATLVASGIGAIVGVLLVGRLSDRLIEHGHYRARIWTGAAAFFVAALFLLPGFLSGSLYATGILFFIGALGLGGVNPPMGAAQLDIMHSRLWGRAESILSSLRYAFVAIAPLIFGYLSTVFGGTAHPLGPTLGKAIQNNAVGLGLTLAVMLATLIGAGIALLLALRSYPRDVATAHAFEDKTRELSQQESSSIDNDSRLRLE
ncbi:MAG: MFS transporter [Gammaproteobacteria bacterium]